MPHWSGAARKKHVLGSGRGGQQWVQKWSKLIFSEAGPRPLGVLKQVVKGYCEPSWTHVSPCKLQKSLEMGNCGVNVATEGGLGECTGRGDRGGVQEECKGGGGGACVLSKQSEQGFGGMVTGGIYRQGARGIFGGHVPGASEEGFGGWYRGGSGRKFSWCPSRCILIQARQGEVRGACN